MIDIIITLAILGVIVYLIETFLPIAEPFKLAIRIVAGVFVLIYLLRVFGFSDFPVTRFR